MLLRRNKALADKTEDDRQKMIEYKKTFGSAEGKNVLFDLMNRYHVLNPHGGDLIKEGQRSVVLDILSRLHINMAEFDKLLRGEFNG